MTLIYPKPKILVEPFAVGGIISLTALFENLIERVVMVELDDEIAAVWQLVVNGDTEWLANRILSFHLAKETVIQELKKILGHKKKKHSRQFSRIGHFMEESWLRVLDFLNTERTVRVFVLAGILSRLLKGLKI
jgi:hypothetical protein